MNLFSIEFISKDPYYKGCMRGEILINDFKEHFSSPIEYWKTIEYEKQWKDGLYRIINGEKQSILITSIQDPQKSSYINTWPIYILKNKIVLHNSLIIYENLTSKFEIDKLYDFIPEYYEISEDGDKISEWEITLDALNSFYGKLIN